MTPEKEKELREGITIGPHNLKKVVEGTLCIYFGDGNIDEDARAHMLANLQFGSHYMRRELAALDMLLAHSDGNEYLILLVGEIVGANLPTYDSKSCYEWVRQKTAMIREIFDQAVSERGKYF